MAWRAAHPMLGLIKAWAGCQWKTLAEALSATEGCCTAMQYDDLASPEETELSPESAQLFLRGAPDKYKSSLWAMAANA